jgi:GNAT superfamily N-acetyltransferase
MKGSENQMATPILVRHVGADLSELLDDLTEVYEEIYAEPPYNSGPLFSRSEFIRRTSSQAQKSGFVLIAARIEDHLVGFSFGLSFDTRWWGGDSTAPPEEMKESTKFAVIELLVREPFRGSGLGRTLLVELLKDRPEDYAILTSVPQAAAHSMYERWGWRKVGTVRAKSYAPIMDAMAFPLKGQ